LRDADIVDYFMRSVETEDGATFLAFDDERIVGYITIFIREQVDFYAIKKVGAISGLMVHKDYRRRGIASKLLNASLAFFEKKNVKYFTVYTAVANEAAIRFYKRHGMHPLHMTLIGEAGSL
jgi:ribosomal protein S18 acetylase RimI-like enzyme